eukprot:13681648-Heterocapsa_arctica.AAC.1
MAARAGNGRRRRRRHAPDGAWRNPRTRSRHPGRTEGNRSGRQKSCRVARQSGLRNLRAILIRRKGIGRRHPRNPGGAMYGQPKRKGCLAAEDQVRAVEHFAKPGLVDEDPQDPDQCQGSDEDMQQQLDAGKAPGKGAEEPTSKGKG